MIGGLTFNRNTNVRVGFNKFLQIRQKNVFAQCSGYADMYVSDAQLVNFLDLRFSFFQRVKGILNVVIEKFSFFR